MFDAASPRTIHFGLDDTKKVFKDGAENTDVSADFLAKSSNFVDGLEPLLISRASP